MNEEELIAAFDGLELVGAEHLTSRYKPVTLLWVMGRMAVGAGHVVHWSEFRTATPQLFRRFGSPFPGAGLIYPFWELSTSPLWSVRTISPRPVGDFRAPDINWLNANDPLAGFSEESAELLADDELRNFVADRLIRRFFPASGQRYLRPDAPRSARDWVLHALRRLGYLSQDDSVMLTRTSLVDNCLSLGMPASLSKSIQRAVRQLINDEMIAVQRGSVDADDQPFHPPRPGQHKVELLQYLPPELPIGAHSGPSEGLAAERQAHSVACSVRRLPPGQQPSPQQLELHREAVRSARIVDRPLPPGYTFVRSHRRESRE